MLHTLKSILGISDQDPHDIGCRAVRDDGEICGNDIMGRSGDGKIQYCSKHAPSEAVPYGRMDTLEFYVPEEDKLVRAD